MRTVIIAQARMTSSRLPGKVMKTVLGKPLLAYFIERLQRATLADQVIIATTTNETDEPIVELCRSLSVGFTRGSENDVLQRYFDASVVTCADTVVRVTSDCPLIDPALIDDAIALFRQRAGQTDYVSNSLTITYPRGMDVEVFSFRALAEAHAKATQNVEREHVTPFLYQHPEMFRIEEIQSPHDLSRHRWTVDTPEDLELITRILEALYPLKKAFDLADILKLLNQHPDWPDINSQIRQKTLGQ